ncbi:U6 snRNA-associated-like-Sm protein LSm4, putative [Rhizoctonia solani AG-3 Rhs1AP]|uniref:U6 snRNA-associated-like-Sm protein LSm4, putative n=1 Tax=Rhizoctonia solani AG-3 Rhs1AP TaxID=1086054 RepID=X8JHS2_9AGAM|nr:U6 snRNA-associated-like-Sm protein LSm4, putative [Rhizoctonia solani AG-3 Rhs1AP]
MNITLREVYQTSPEGDRFWKLKECYIRGSMIKYLRVPDALLDSVKEEQLRARDANRGRGGAPGGNRGTSLSHMLWITPNPISRRTRCSTKGW